MQNNVSHTTRKNSHIEDASYEAVEKRRRQEAILMSDNDKFYLFMKMMKIGKMLNNATVTHKKM